MILKRMKRRHSRADAVALCERARQARPDVVFGADLIAGFPTETEAMFETPWRRLRIAALPICTSFPIRNGPARRRRACRRWRKHVRKERAARLRAAGETAAREFLQSRIGHEARVLIEQTDEQGIALGRCEHFASVRLTQGRPGEIVTCQIASLQEDTLIGESILPQPASSAA